MTTDISGVSVENIVHAVAKSGAEQDQGLSIRRSWLSLDDTCPFSGLFASKAFKQGDVICIYTGVVYRTAEALKLADKSYLMRLGEQCYIDARQYGPTGVGSTPCLARYINDCINPAGYNVHFDKSPSTLPYPCTYVLAKRDINKNEELFADYGKRYWAGCAHSITPYRIPFMELHMRRIAATAAVAEEEEVVVVVAITEQKQELNPGLM